MRPGHVETYGRMNLELAPYQGFPHGRVVAVGDPLIGLAPESSVSPDAGGPDEFLQSRRQVGNPEGVALAESSLTAGGALIPPVTR